jgi:hypothetical protein
MAANEQEKMLLSHEIFTQKLSRQDEEKSERGCFSRLFLHSPEVSKYHVKCCEGIPK